MASETYSPYFLDRGWLGTSRLYLQHYMCKARMGYLINPKTEAALKEVASPSILDLATGPGVWAVEVAQGYPSAKVLGLDVSDAQFPPASTRPANLSFETYNFFDPVPEEYVGKFDVVHIAYVITALYKGGRDALIEHVVQFLKPGGWVNWVEPINPPIVTMEPGTLAVSEPIPTMVYANKLNNAMSAGNWTKDFPGTLSSVGGFVETLQDTPPMDPALLHLETQICSWISHEFMENLGRLIGTQEVRDGVAEALRVTEQKIKDGFLLHWRFTVGVGRKPG